MAVGFYQPSDFQSVEDRLAVVTNRIREIRQGMQAGPPNEVRLNFGTFLHYVGELEKLAERYHGEYRSQIAVASAKATRERKKAEREKRPKVSR